jgi:putative AlgH/UPF0301 family transcriptional regulator
MALSKLCFFATLTVLVAFAAMRRSDVHTREFDVLTRNSWLYHPAPATDESLRQTSLPPNQLVRSNRLFSAQGDRPSAVFLPVQSKNPEDLGAGKLLVASRGLADPNFAKTVVLLVRCDVDGVLGLILNRHTDVPLSRVLDQFKAAKDRSDAAFLGGPMETQVAFALLRSTAKLDGAEQVLSGVYLISSKDLFEKTVSGRPDPDAFHVYVGYSGWTKDQLRKEVELGSWFIFQGDARTVFDSDPDSLWRQMIQKTELRMASISPRMLNHERPTGGRFSFALLPTVQLPIADRHFLR